MSKDDIIAAPIKWGIPKLEQPYTYIYLVGINVGEGSLNFGKPFLGDLSIFFATEILIIEFHLYRL